MIFSTPHIRTIGEQTGFAKPTKLWRRSFHSDDRQCRDSRRTAGNMEVVVLSDDTNPQFVTWDEAERFNRARRVRSAPDHPTKSLFADAFYRDNQALRVKNEPFNEDGHITRARADEDIEVVFRDCSNDTFEDKNNQSYALLMPARERYEEQVQKIEENILPKSVCV